MSTFKCEVVPVILEPHKNSDNLSIATVKGWQVVVRTQDFEGVKLAAYLPIGVTLPEKPEWEFLRQRKFRIKTIKLRGALSQGLLVPAKPGWVEGQDVTEELGAKKWEPTMPQRLGGDCIETPEKLDRYTDIENWKNYPNVIQEGEPVVITSKIHGTNARFGLIDGKFYVGSHNTTKSMKYYEGLTWWEQIQSWFGKKFYIPPPTIWSQIAHNLNMEARLRTVAIGAFTPDAFIVYGEIFGKGIQKLTYGKDKPDFRIFDIKYQGRYFDWNMVQHLAKGMELETVPVLKEGPFTREDLTLAKGTEEQTFGVAHVREGIVIKPLRERAEHMGRVILKYINDDYLLNKKDDEEEQEIPH